MKDTAQDTAHCVKSEVKVNFFWPRVIESGIHILDIKANKIYYYGVDP